MIRTRQMRRYRSRWLGEMLVEHTYEDRPANIETWDEGAAQIAKEFGMDPTDVHLVLMDTFPELYGLPS